MTEEPIQIKRYPNRRLYSRKTSKYVSISEIEELIRQGHTIDVRDSQTGEEFTHQLLTQIILDRHPEKIALFPVAMLHSIVRSNDLMTEFLHDYFRYALTYLDYFEQHGSAKGNLPKPMHWAKAWLEGFRPTKGHSQDEPDAVEGAHPSEDKLVRRVAELEERIRQLESVQQAPQ